MRRPTNARPLEFVLDPELLDSPSVDRAFLLQPDIGYIRVTGFDPQTAKQLKDAIENLGGEKLKALVLDLRDNPGGVVQTALEAASYFLQPGQKLLSVKGRSLEDQDRSTCPRPRPVTPFRLPCW